jgi:hypothetical protein
MHLVFAAFVLAGTLGPELPQPAAEPHDPQLQRIRQALAAKPMKLPPTDTQPTFRVQVTEKALVFWRSVDRDAFSGGPVPPGGLYAFQLRQQLGNPWAGQPLVTIDVLSLARRFNDAIGNARRVREKQAAESEVKRSLATFCAANVCAAAEQPQR